MKTHKGVLETTIEIPVRVRYVYYPSTRVDPPECEVLSVMCGETELFPAGEVLSDLIGQCAHDAECFDGE